MKGDWCGHSYEIALFDVVRVLGILLVFLLNVLDASAYIGIGEGVLLIQ